MNSSDSAHHIATGGGASGRKAVSHPNTQQWLRTISRGRQSSYDRTKAAVKSNLATNGKMNPAFNSTSDYLRNLVYSNSAAPRRAVSASNLRSTTSTSHTRQPEDMQEEIMHLKKNLVGLTNENLTLKTQMKKLENDALKKHKEIEELLDPNQRLINVHDKGSKLAVNSMKQKILRLEQTLKDKDSMLQKLKSDLKTTRLEELRAQMESMYQEILRLQRVQPEPDSLTLPRELQTRLKTMNDTILRLNETNDKLQKENKLLRAKTKKESDTDDDDDDGKNDYKKMQKDELVKVVLRLEKKLSSTANLPSKTDSKKQTLTLSEGKVKELLDEKEKLVETVKKLKNEKLKFKAQLEEKQQEIVKLRREIEAFIEKSGKNGIPRQSRNKTRSPTIHSKIKSGSSGSSPEVTVRKRNHSADLVQHHKSPDSSPEISKKSVVSRRTASVDKTKDSQKLSNKSSVRSSGKRDSRKTSPSPRLSARRTEKIEQFTRNRAAKTIQRQWRHYQDKNDDAISVIDSAAKAHLRRKTRLQKGDRSDDDDDDENEHRLDSHRATNRSDSGIDDAISMIGAAARGHSSRKSNAAKLAEHDQKHSSRSNEGRKSSKISVQQNAKRANSLSNTDDDADDFFSK